MNDRPINTSIDLFSGITDNVFEPFWLKPTCGILYLIGVVYYWNLTDSFWLAVVGGFLALPVAALFFGITAVAALLSSEFALSICEKLFVKSPGSTLHRVTAMVLSWLFLIPAMMLISLGDVPGYTS